MGNVNTIDENVQKALMGIRRAGGQLTLSVPPQQLKGEVIKLRDKCNKAIALLGGEE